MVRIGFIEHDGTRHDIEADDGYSLMEIALANGIPGIDADCGGSCSCGTCHVYIDAAWLELVGAPSDEERELLDLNDDVRSTSRLACQINVTDAMDGLIVHTPENQF